MKIIIEPEVHQAIDNFYDAAILRHRHTLSYETVERKKQRLYDGIRSLSSYHSIFGLARLNERWIKEGWQEFICEDFHIAYEVLMDKDGQTMIIVKDAIHSYLYLLPRTCRVGQSSELMYSPDGECVLINPIY